MVPMDRLVDLRASPLILFQTDPLLLAENLIITRRRAIIKRKSQIPHNHLLIIKVSGLTNVAGMLLNYPHPVGLKVVDLNQ
jgi:hypothetical protein